jgi:phenylpropionate dioxygenase-like ring-hydroxylating dioxygenase large terminal subunit
MSSPAGPIDYKALVQDDRIHASLYTDPRIFADEMERIFHRGWVFVGHDSEIAQAGDFVTRHLGTEPVIMVRGREGEVSVLVNRCMHRGTMLCPLHRGSAPTFTCPYHGWTYGLNGALLGVPYPGAYTTFDKGARGLTRAPRVASYRGFVFASLSAVGISLAEHLGPATRLIDRSCDLSPAGAIELTAGWVKHRCPANWKMLPENDSDGYHLGFVHQALFKTIRSQYQRVVGDERAIKAVVRDWGHGHIEIDWSPGYQGPVRVVRWRFGLGRGRLRSRAGATGRTGGGPSADHGGSGPRAHLPQPVSGGDQHRDRRARERRGVRALAHADVSQGRSRVQGPLAPDGRGGDGAGIVPHAGGSDGGQP